jgi:2-polyprenyl-6-methoxyphenol hydroxylase-like FAD-dependent oxidoreductase
MKRPERGSTAVVLGASISGLLAARVLADFYSSVIVVERDVLPAQPVTRRGVPQGALPHGITTRGITSLGELFPGLLEELAADGTRVWNDGDLSRFCMSFNGHRFVRSGKVPDPESVVMYFVHRPFLEWRLRRRVTAIPNVKIMQGQDAVRLTSTAQRDRVTGVALARSDSGVETALTADLIVDATGRGSRVPVFLDELGYRRPREDTLTVHVTYAGLPVHLPPGTLREYMTFATPEPSRPRGYWMFAGQDDVYMLAVYTVAGEKAPADLAALLDCLSDMAPPHVLAAARRAEPLADLTQYRFPSNRWRRYDRLTRTPDGLIVIGDALCNFNPIYGQGMSVAAIEALILRDCLQQGDRNLPRRFFRSSTKEIRVAWRAAVSSDLALPQIEGKRSVSIRMANAYAERVQAAAETDPAMVQLFLRSISMIDPPSHLLRPSTVLRVIKTPRRRPVAREAQTADTGNAVATESPPEARSKTVTRQANK